MCNAIYAVTERAVKRIPPGRPDTLEGEKPDCDGRGRVCESRRRHNHTDTSGEIAFTAPGAGLRCRHDRSRKTTAARATKSGARNRDRPTATATNASSGTALVQPAGNEVRCPRPSR